MNNNRVYRCLPRQIISNGTLSLSCIQPEHMELIRQWRNAQMSVLRQKVEISAVQQIEYYRSFIGATLGEREPDNILLSLQRDEKLIGYGGLVHIAWQDLRAEVSFLLDPALAASESDYPRIFKGYLELISEIAFDDLGFNRLFTETWTTRHLHIETLEANGFRLEGVLKEHTIQCGVATDSAIHGRLASERMTNA